MAPAGGSYSLSDQIQSAERKYERTGSESDLEILTALYKKEDEIKQHQLAYRAELQDQDMIDRLFGPPEITPPSDFDEELTDPTRTALDEPRINTGFSDEHRDTRSWEWTRGEGSWDITHNFWKPL